MLEIYDIINKHGYQKNKTKNAIHNFKRTQNVTINTKLYNKFYHHKKQKEFNKFSKFGL